MPPCQPPTPDSPQQSLSLPCTIRAKPSWNGDSHHPTGGHREGVGFVDLTEFFILLLTLSSVELSQVLVTGSKNPLQQRAGLNIFLIFFPLTPRDSLTHVPCGSPAQADRSSHTWPEFKSAWQKRQNLSRNCHNLPLRKVPPHQLRL